MKKPRIEGIKKYTDSFIAEKGEVAKDIKNGNLYAEEGDNILIVHWNRPKVYIQMTINLKQEKHVQHDCDQPKPFFKGLLTLCSCKRKEEAQNLPA